MFLSTIINIFNCFVHTDPFRSGTSISINPISSSTAEISWEITESVCPSTYFIVEDKLLNLEQCEADQTNTKPSRFTTGDTEATLSDLDAGSTYTVSVSSQTSSGTDEVFTRQETWITPQSGKLQ